MKSLTRYALAFLLVNAAAELTAACRPEPAQASTKPFASLTTLADSSYRVIVSWNWKVIPGITRDSVKVQRAGQAGPAGIFPKDVNATADTSVWQSPAPGVTQSVAVCVLAWGKGIIPPGSQGAGNNGANCANVTLTAPALDVADLLTGLTARVERVP